MLVASIQYRHVGGSLTSQSSTESQTSCEDALGAGNVHDCGGDLLMDSLMIVFRSNVGMSCRFTE